MGKCRLCDSPCSDRNLASQNQLCIQCWNKYPEAADPRQSRFRKNGD